ncbi:MAG TPA: hypothetical protein VL460_01650 [Caulobacteraceae bacterium]|jgi:hypothetical protein|nr:hypothetical protein [Caulobacteraceae bacterium]
MLHYTQETQQLGKNMLPNDDFKARFNMTRRSAYSRWLSDPTLNIAMTLNFNRPVSLANARSAIGECFGKVDRKLLGRRFTRRRNDRTTGVFMFEHLKSNLHAHGLLRVQHARLERFSEMFPPTQRGLWSDVWAGGSQWTTDAANPAGFAFYIAKEQHASSAPETMLFLEDFFPTEG